jgi:hypothetical protein
MKSKLLLVLFAMAATLGITALPAAAEPLAASCPFVAGQVCLAEPSGVLVLVPAGKGQTFSPALPVVDMTNGTTTAYCVAATPVNFILSAGHEVTRSMSVIGVSPAPPGTFCPL